MGRQPAYDLDSVNHRLKTSDTGFQIWQRGNRLSLRGTLPPKPNSKHDRPYQQTLSLGIFATPSGFEFAENKAREIASLLAQRRFTWQEIGIDPPPNGK